MITNEKSEEHSMGIDCCCGYGRYFLMREQGKMYLPKFSGFSFRNRSGNAADGQGCTECCRTIGEHLSENLWT